jgi:hypothetical protein
MKSVVFRASILFALLLLAWVGPGCTSKANPVVPSTGGPAQGGLVESKGLDSGAADALATSDAQRAADTGTNLDVNSISCDLLTYIHTQKGCLPGLACYPVGGSGKCQTVGNQGAFNTCVPGDTTGTLTCAEKLACIPTADMGPVCLTLCDFAQPACDLGNFCVLLNGSASVGSCQLLPS